MNEFEKDFIESLRKDYPKIFELSMFFMERIEGFRKQFKILFGVVIFLLSSIVLPMWLIMFEFFINGS